MINYIDNHMKNLNTSAQPEAAEKKKRKRSTIRPTYGSIRAKHGAWFWEYYAAPGQRKMERIASMADLRSKKDVADLINKRIAQLGPVGNTRKADAPRTGNVLISEFAKNVYLPWAQRETKAATYHGCRKMWEHRLEKHFGQRKLH